MRLILKDTETHSHNLEAFIESADAVKIGLDVLKLRALFLLCLAAVALGGPSNETRTGLAEQIRLEVERIQEARSAYISAQRDHAESVARIDAQIGKLEDDRRRLDLEVARDR